MLFFFLLRFSFFLRAPRLVRLVFSDMHGVSPDGNQRPSVATEILGVLVPWWFIKKPVKSAAPVPPFP
jgi:hypothetical protein